MSVPTELPAVHIVRHACAYRLHAHAEHNAHRAGKIGDSIAHAGQREAFSALANGGHRELAAALQQEARMRLELHNVLDRPDDGSKATSAALDRYTGARARVQTYLDDLR